VIVIITNQFDDSSSEVLEWLGNESVLRINSDGISNYLKNNLVKIDFSMENVLNSAVWFRKGGYSEVDIECPNKDMVKHSTQELYALNSFFCFTDFSTRTLGTPNVFNLFKPSVLLALKKHSLEIPPTLITNQKTELIQFRNRHKEIIMKPLSEGTKFTIDGNVYKLYTEKISDSTIDDLDTEFFPTLFQKCIQKKYEIRSFILNNEIYSMAMLGPNNNQDVVDIRWHLQVAEIRSVPYKLPPELELNIMKFMKSLNLDTGSLDIIKGMDDEYYFLELNASGQFGNLSHSCNYYLEKKIANYLKNGRSI
jgi:ATP-GRASP peptide maturase of grasp-with-spasm system